MTIYLDYYKAKTVDLKDYYRKYDNPEASYRLLQGAPLLINICGHYVKAFDIPELVVNRSYRVLSAINKWLTDLKAPSNVLSREVLDFKWRF